MASNEREAHLLNIGHQCSEESCHLVDFLPFKCQHCTQSFCGEHFKPAAHKCAAYDESKFNRIAPSCPLCNEPIAIPPGQDPNHRMEHHFVTDCTIMTGRPANRKNKATPTCARAKCGKVLFAPISCEGCKEQFCPQHRFPADHACAGRVKAPASGSFMARNVPTKASTAAAVAAVKRNLASSVLTGSGASVSNTKHQPTATPSPRVTTTGGNASSSNGSSTTLPTIVNPFNKVDRCV
ncbi:hypothetical protein PLICRDRAFT_113464 [Plicaturopsis crispa FD-325 SS-3]|nr:hypothetical protein PLICRDRAFT_113464 [Plicaturopsis crispa FD-325 SS-3]